MLGSVLPRAFNDYRKMWDFKNKRGTICSHLRQIRRS